MIATIIQGADYNVIYRDIPCDVGGMVHENEDGTYTVILNSRMTRERQEAAARHEIRHMNGNDFNSGMSADEIEMIRHE